MGILVLQRLFIEAFIDLFYFPVWWYTKGLVHAAKWCWHLFVSGNERLAPGLWLKNILVPMFGQYDLQGRLVSFFMRFVQIVFRSFALLLWLLVCIFVFFVWLALPVLVFYGLYLQLIPKK